MQDRVNCIYVDMQDNVSEGRVQVECVMCNLLECRIIRDGEAFERYVAR